MSLAAPTSLWQASAPPPPPTDRLDADTAADVAIIGAGYTGLSAALHLAERGLRVVVLEAEEIGFGASGRNVGLVNAGLWIKPSEVFDAMGPDRGRRLLDQLGAAPQLVFDLIDRFGIACEPVRNGTLHCAVGSSGAAELKVRADQLQQLGAPVELLSESDAAARIGSKAYRGALFDPRAGTIQPLAYARGLARAAMTKGARIFTRSAVYDLADQGSTWRLNAADGSVVAGHVIVATESYSAGALAHLRSQYVRLFYFNVATRPLSAAELRTILPARHGIWDTRSVLSSARLDAAGRLIFGSVGALSGSGIAVHRNWARRALHKIFPALGAITLNHEWYGAIGMTPDAIPRFHRLGRNILAIGAYNGRGIAPGTSFGRELAHLVAGDLHESELVMQPSPVRPALLGNLREGFYEAGARAIHFTGARF